MPSRSVTVASGGRLQERAGLEVPAHEAAELERHAVARRELQVRDAGFDFAGRARAFGEALRVERGEPHEAGAPRCGDVVRRIVRAEELGLVVLVERHERGEPARPARVTGERAVLRARQLEAKLRLSQQHDQRQRDGAGHENSDRSVGLMALLEHNCIAGQLTATMTVPRMPLRENLSFLLTNRIPRRWLTLFMGWLSPIEHPLVRTLGIGLWRLFSDLDLSEAKTTRFRSLQDCFTRELKPGARAD